MLAAKLRIAVYCVVALSIPVAPARAVDECGGEVPVVTHGRVERTGLSEAEILAMRVARSADTTAEGTPLLPRGGSGLAEELARVLRAVRAAHPQMEAVTARSPWEPGALIVHLEPTLFEEVSSALAAPGATAPLCTAHASFDALNVSLGVGAVESFPFMDAIVMRFDPYRDMTLAALAYQSLDGVRGAEPNFHLGDGPDIGARWVDGTWYLVFREASGDCPSGCIGSELHFFTERDAVVERLDFDRSERLAPFARILLERQWGSP